MGFILPKPLILGGREIAQQTTMLDIIHTTLKGPTRKYPYFRIILDCGLDPRGCPAPDNIGWLLNARLVALLMLDEEHALKPTADSPPPPSKTHHPSAVSSGPNGEGAKEHKGPRRKAGAEQEASG